jgi:hypothetical protein
MGTRAETQTKTSHGTSYLIPAPTLIVPPPSPTLALNFVTFINTLKLFQDGEATADQFNTAADDFRKAASKNATFFVYTGKLLHAFTLLCY